MNFNKNVVNENGHKRNWREGALISNNSETDLNYVVLEDYYKYVVLVSLPRTTMENTGNEVKLKTELHFY